MSRALCLALSAPGRRQRGAATLVVVMVLFFVVTLAAAYASRNLIFEQRTSANQLRSTVSAEATEAGIDWMLGMLSSGRIDENCEQTNDPAFGTFRQRYLNFNATSGIVTRVLHPAGVDTPFWAACKRVGDIWTCKCPTIAAPDLPANAAWLPAGNAAFAVRFVNQITRPGVMRVEVNGCTSYDLDCLRFVGAVTSTIQCASRQCAIIGMHPSVKRVPSAALTARLAVGGTALTVINQDTATAGLAAHSGGGNGVLALTAYGPSGSTSAGLVQENDLSFGILGLDAPGCTMCMFTNTFGLRPEVYQRQTSVIQVDCNAACDAAAVNAVLVSGRSRVVWLAGPGGLVIGAGDSIGAAGDPVTLIIEGPLTMSAAAVGATLSGLVYTSSATLDAGIVRGALISAGNVSANGTGQVVYDRAALARLRSAEGAFVRIPGSWRDFP